MVTVSVHMKGDDATKKVSFDSKIVHDHEVEEDVIAALVSDIRPLAIIEGTELTY